MLDAVIVGAGPYGLSIAACFKRRGIAFRIFGRPMESWLAQMPRGMMLKSDGFASNLCDPENAFTLKRFCAERHIDYADSGVPVSLETFGAYGLAFKDGLVPDLEEVLVSRIEQLPDGFVVTLETGETVKARRVVLAVGITHFAHLPSHLAHLPPELFSHSSHHRDLERFQSRRVVVLGGGASALDLAGLLHRAGANATLVNRKSELKFHTKPTGAPRRRWQRIRHPQSGLGPGLRSRFFANAPLAFHGLPERFRLWNVRRALGPSGGWFAKDMVMGKVGLLLGQRIESAAAQNGEIRLHLQALDGSRSEIVSDHLIAATGYKVSIDRLTFLTEALRFRLKAIDGAPVLTKNFESSVPGLYFVGVAAANSFGPLMRFAFGARFAAEHLTAVVAKSAKREHSPAPSVQFGDPSRVA